MVYETGVQGETPSMDTTLSIYADDCATELAYNDDGGEGYYSRIEFAVEGASWTDVKDLYR